MISLVVDLNSHSICCPLFALFFQLLLIIHLFFSQLATLHGRIGARGPNAHPLVGWAKNSGLARAIRRFLEAMRRVPAMLQRLEIAHQGHVQAKLFFCIVFKGLVLFFPGIWLEWSVWSQCSTTCDLGSTVRARACSAGEGFCLGNATEYADCLTSECAGNHSCSGYPLSVSLSAIPKHKLK